MTSTGAMQNRVSARSHQELQRTEAHAQAASLQPRILQRALMSGIQPKVQPISMLSSQIPSMFQTVKHPSIKVRRGKILAAVENFQPTRWYRPSFKPYISGIKCH